MKKTLKDLCLWHSVLMFAGFVFCGCGAEVPTEPGEQVVSDKWIEPKDIGKDYSIDIEDLKFNVAYTLDTGKTVTFKEGRPGDGVQMTEDGSIGAFIMVPDTDDQGNPRFLDGHPATKQVYIGNIVPEGDPIVTLSAFFNGERLPVRKDRYMLGTPALNIGIRIDRVLDYNLPIYLEYQTQERSVLGGAVERGRSIVVVPKGETYAIGDVQTLGSYEKHARSSISILPHTEMQKLDLPVSVGYPGETEDLPVEIRGIPKGHKFRPYRIASSSFVLGQIDQETDW